ncbi:ATP-binding protein [Streptomyces sp. NY05-11A]|uniref:ATP-binding protein n=1 Tax=Streptomyces soliscabiei TaxID=588897 RepID=UPI0029B564F7|nr:ATP-binding protein [Streptomyces sp. NY05-11A]MDX2682759.1 ATP-binding protein [Streptomyces sp. NY05-11A]
MAGVPPDQGFSASDGTAAETTVALDGKDGCIARARQLTGDFLTHVRRPGGPPVSVVAVDLSQLVVSELVTNALRYAPGPVLLQLRVSGGTVEIAVWDSDPVLPAPRAPDPTRVGQHGLEIVRAVAEEFEVVRAPVGKRIVARLGLTDAR